MADHLPGWGRSPGQGHLRRPLISNLASDLWGDGSQSGGGQHTCTRHSFDVTVTEEMLAEVVDFFYP